MMGLGGRKRLMPSFVTSNSFTLLVPSPTSELDIRYDMDAGKTDRHRESDMQGKVVRPISQERRSSNLGIMQRSTRKVETTEGGDGGASSLSTSGVMAERDIYIPYSAVPYSTSGSAYSRREMAQTEFYRLLPMQQHFLNNQSIIFFKKKNTVILKKKIRQGCSMIY
ncbi:hypothetical protein L873DRAFT_229063 [Choiromyces venosus 120613-1]|uniref:Uncharacterized protein n=1 Tax=Choiromyces venosus 120613-1 TaxID=1336337 RepID=A0A3N4K1A3_9PEZI|nr:hypothetical protein L873DRAFT_229063 [Choiromyces venosus 120613-1]